MNERDLTATGLLSANNVSIVRNNVQVNSEYPLQLHMLLVDHHIWRCVF